MKYYRVKKDTFLWKAGAIISDQDKGQYCAIEDVWSATSKSFDEYISASVIEDSNNAEFFERVYPDTLKGKLFHTKDQLIELYNGAFK